MAKRKGVNYISRRESARISRQNRKITSKIENEVLPLEETTALYQEGKRLCKELQEELEAAEKLVEDAAKE